jgi:hypothetical protein
VTASSARPHELAGLWRRSLLVRADGTRDITTSVSWLQGERTFIDLRQPATLPAAASFGRCRNELSRAGCLELAEQQGFAGRLNFDGVYFEWVRSLDFQPPTASADAGSLGWDGNVLVERGRDVAYLEHWQREAAAPPRPVCALKLRDNAEGVQGFLLRIGDCFMFARDRAAAVTPQHTLRQCIEQVPSLAEARALVDCEISLGEVRAGSLYITASTLPYRVDDVLDPRLARSALAVSDRTSAGTLCQRSFEIVEIEGEPDDLLRDPAR